MSYPNSVLKLMSPRELKKVARRLGYVIYLDPRTDALRCRRLPMTAKAIDTDVAIHGDACRARRDEVLIEILRILQGVERLDSLSRRSSARERLNRTHRAARLARRGRGRPRAMTDTEARRAMLRLSNGQRDRDVADSFGVSRATLYLSLRRVRGAPTRRSPPRKQGTAAREPAAPRGSVFRTNEEALAAYHLEAHEERDALIGGLDGVREGLDAAIAALRGSPEITDPVFETLRAALVPIQRVLDTALEKIARPLEFAPCCDLSAAAHSATRHADRGGATDH
jgi:hypothetical protein